MIRALILAVVLFGSRIAIADEPAPPAEEPKPWAANGKLQAMLAREKERVKVLEDEKKKIHTGGLK